MNNIYGFWSHKYDFSEINKYNWKLVFKDTFGLDIKRISLLSMLFALEIVITIISKYLMGALTIFQFYTVEFSLIGILFIYLSTNWLYASIICIFSNFLRVILPAPSDFIGVLAMTLSDISFLITFAIVFLILKKIILFKVKKDNQIRWYITIIVLSGIIAMISSAFLSMLANHYFIFDMYNTLYPGIMPEKNSVLWISYLWSGFIVSVIKFTINVFTFSFFIKLLVNLINKHLF
ncbi:ECF transporter S component [Spiroplasma diminutum]|uniref:Uncharacterized protein n=1 Tax=Spiroplasma diminutum CUAS-1 TaxID=1276221 RepID=S5M1L4_9MOLU|nr:ECF transporter S component [Spiroplasma diminutum]AGR41952.1 hypothetical protein SDIMI_v3c02480 [Spiroplasma diminutum CUAS-1]